MWRARLCTEARRVESLNLRKERSGRNVFPKRPTFSDCTSQSQQFDGRLGEPSLPEMAGSRYPYLPAQEHSGRDVFPKRPTFSDYTSRSQQFDGRLGEPSLPEKAGISISLPSCTRTFR